MTAMHRRNRHRFAFPFALLVAFASPSHAVRVADPPSQQLAQAPGSSLVVARVESIGDESVRFRVIERLRGEKTPRVLDLPVDPDTRAALAQDARYVVGVADERLVRLPGGRRTIDVPYFLYRAATVGELICPDGDACRAVLQLPYRAKEPTDVRLAALTAALHDPEPSVARIAAAELATRSSLHAAMDRSHGKRFYSFTTDARRDARARTLLLEVGEAMGPARTGAWAYDAAREILAATPVSFDGASIYLPSLVAQSLHALKRADPARESDAALAARWIDSSHDAIVEMALETRVALSPGDSLAFVERKLAGAIERPEIRRVLEQHRRRLEAVDPAAQGGAGAIRP